MTAIWGLSPDGHWHTLEHAAGGRVIYLDPPGILPAGRLAA
ncbi:MAG: hypothetical protein ACR2FU_17800 [Streptosporangiaceae bacterium]